MTNYTITTLDEIIAIPGNHIVFNDLIKLITTDRTIAFVGAGASAGVYPLWGELIEKLSNYAVIEGKAETSDAARWKADKTSSRACLIFCVNGPVKQSAASPRKQPQIG